MLIEFIVLAIIAIVGVMFILNARKNFSEDENSPRKHADALTANEQEPSRTGKFQVKAMLKSSSKNEKKEIRKKKLQEQLEEQSESLPDPFADD